MEKDQCRSLSKSICVEFARDQVLRAQQLLERFRLCDCPDVGGFECRCVSEEVIETIRNKSYKERSTQTEGNNGESHTEKLLAKASKVRCIFTVWASMFERPLIYTWAVIEHEVMYHWGCINSTLREIKRD